MTEVKNDLELKQEALDSLRKIYNNYFLSLREEDALRYGLEQGLFTKDNVRYAEIWRRIDHLNADLMYNGFLHDSCIDYNPNCTFLLAYRQRMDKLFAELADLHPYEWRTPTIL